MTRWQRRRGDSTSSASAGTPRRSTPSSPGYSPTAPPAPGGHRSPSPETRARRSTDPRYAGTADDLPTGLRPVAAGMSEAEVAAFVADACRTLGLLRYHTYRSDRSPAGFPDEVIVGPSGLLFRELKRQTTQPTAAQWQWLETLAAAGSDVGVWRPSDVLSGRVAAELQAVARRAR